jgi:hypothetical protein
MECFSALWDTKWSVGLVKMAGDVPVEDWASTIACLRRIVSAESAGTEAPDSNQEWAQMFLNRSTIFLIETFMKMKAGREQSQLETRRLRRVSDVDWVGITLLLKELGWSLVEEGGEGVSSSSFLSTLNERFAIGDPVAFEEGASFMDSLRKFAETLSRKVVVLTVLTKGSGSASLVNMPYGEARPIRLVRWDGRVWWASPQGVSENLFNLPLPSIIDRADAHQRGYRTLMGVQALGSGTVSNLWAIQNLWNKAGRRAKVTLGNRKDYVLVPGSMTMPTSVGAARV